MPERRSVASGRKSQRHSAYSPPAAGSIGHSPSTAAGSAFSQPVATPEPAAAMPPPRSRCRLPMYLLFHLITVVALASIFGLVVLLDSQHRAAASGAARTAVTSALRHAQAVVTPPFAEAMVTARRNAMISKANNFTFNNRALIQGNGVQPDGTLAIDAFKRYASNNLTANIVIFAQYQMFPVPMDLLPAKYHTENGKPRTRDYWTASGYIDYCFVFGLNSTAHPVFSSWSVSTDPSKIPEEVAGAPANDESWDFTDVIFGVEAQKLTPADANGKWGTSPDIWMDVDGLPKMYITAYAPVRFGPDGSIQLTESVDVLASGLERYLAQIELPAAEAALLHDASGTMLASTFAGLPNFDETGDSPRLWKFAEVPNSRLQGASAVAGAEHAGDLMGQSTVVLLDPEDERVRGFIVAEAPIIADGGLRLTLLVVTPRDFFYQQLTNGRHAAVAFGVAAAFLCLLVAAAVSLALQRPLTALRAAMVPAARLRCDPAEVEAAGRSVIREMAAIQDAFAAMNVKLHEAGTYLPPAVRAAWSAEDAGGEEEDDDDEFPAYARGSECSTYDGRRSRQSSGVRLSQHKTGTKSSFSTRSPSEATGVADEIFVVAAGSKRSVAVLQLNIVGFGAAVAGLPLGPVQEASAWLTNTIATAAAAHRGVLDGFQGDRFTVTFNHVVNCASPGTAAVRCAVAIRTALCGAATTAPATLAGLRLSAGISSRTALVGQLGSATMRRFGLISDGMARATALERLARGTLTEAPVAPGGAEAPGAAIVVAGAAVEEVKLHFDTQPLDFVQLPGTACAAVVFQVGDEACFSHDDEWLYMVAERDDSAGAASPRKVLQRAAADLSREAAMFGVPAHIGAKDAEALGISAELSQTLSTIVDTLGCGGPQLQIASPRPGADSTGEAQPPPAEDTQLGWAEALFVERLQEILLLPNPFAGRPLGWYYTRAVLLARRK